jgi:hypothetical protein
MRRQLIATALLFAGAGWVVADEKDAKPGTTGGPPPGKGWRKNEVPAPTPTPTPAPQPKKSPKVTPTPPPPKPAPAPTPPKEEGIGKYVSAWAHQGIHGTQLAAKIHQLQATMAKAAPTPTPAKKPGKLEVTPPPVTPKQPKKGKGGGETDPTTPQAKTQPEPTPPPTPKQKKPKKGDQDG